jgi:hypothetical protein
MSGNGRAGDKTQRQEAGPPQKREKFAPKREGRRDRGQDERGWRKPNAKSLTGQKPPAVNRSRWVPPLPSSTPIASFECSICHKPIKDTASALVDKAAGGACHFDCAIEKLLAREQIEKSEFISYIGGGRFGVLERENPQVTKDFKIKRIIEWENKDERADWRDNIADHYSMT